MEAVIVNGQPILATYQITDHLSGLSFPFANKQIHLSFALRRPALFTLLIA